VILTLKQWRRWFRLMSCQELQHECRGSGRGPAMRMPLQNIDVSAARLQADENFFHFDRSR
jgi:hypothetical protein